MLSCYRVVAAHEATRLETALGYEDLNVVDEEIPRALAPNELYRPLYVLGLGEFAQDLRRIRPVVSAARLAAVVPVHEELRRGGVEVVARAVQELEARQVASRSVLQALYPAPHPKRLSLACSEGGARLSGPYLWRS